MAGRSPAHSSQLRSKKVRTVITRPPLRRCVLRSSPQVRVSHTAKTLVSSTCVRSRQLWRGYLACRCQQLSNLSFRCTRGVFSGRLGITLTQTFFTLAVRAADHTFRQLRFSGRWLAGLGGTSADLFHNPQFNGTAFLNPSAILFSLGYDLLQCPSFWDGGCWFQSTCSVSKGSIKAIMLSILLEQPLGTTRLCRQG